MPDYWHDDYKEAGGRTDGPFLDDDRENARAVADRENPQAIWDRWERQQQAAIKRLEEQGL